MADIDRAIVNIQQQLNISLKNEQKEILELILQKKDCVGVLPTGFGKSLPYQLSILTRQGLTESADRVGKVIVCSPLVALMKDQVQRVHRLTGCRAEILGNDKTGDFAIRDGKVDFIFGSPETLVGNKEWRSSLQKLQVDTIVVDEFHTIATWGTDEDNQKKAFRKWFSHIGELRSLFPKASVVALSATCTLKIQHRVMKVLCLSPSTKVIKLPPNPTSVKLCVSKVPYNIEHSMAFLADAITDSNFPKTLMYCTSITDCAAIYNYLCKELPDCEIEMYHSETEQEKKDSILGLLQDPSSKWKLIIATNALGMGIDVKDCHSLILFGAPRLIVDLLQEIGRVGRDQQPSLALLLHHGHHLSHVETEVKEFYKAATCRRQMLMTNFLSESEMNSVKVQSGNHTCCDLCMKDCSCLNCTDMLYLEKSFLGISIDSADSVDSTDSDSDFSEELLVGDDYDE
ncbi:probable ATP-dependent DNA helicase RecS [Saccostrea cucullata]|uniref:probable ATP-dependent DNA helicase RecS n=1 Tax=Saccostrea cuccullata TaxID=36930 RepID=UPI002ED086B0